MLFLQMMALAVVGLSGCILERGLDYFGNDLSSGISKETSWGECRSKCGQRDDCLFWTYTEDHLNCYLKNGNSNKKNREHAISGSACGLSPAGIATKKNWAKHTYNGAAGKAWYGENARGDNNSAWAAWGGNNMSSSSDCPATDHHCDNWCRSEWETIHGQWWRRCRVTGWWEARRCDKQARVETLGPEEKLENAPDSGTHENAHGYKCLETGDPGSYAAGDPCTLQYGDDIVIQNQFPGEYMLRQNGDPKFTVDDARIENAAVWKILDVTKQGAGCVRYDDRVLIQNQYPDQKQMLERNGDPKFTVDDTRIENEAAVWKILDVNKQGAGCVRYGDMVLIQNQYPDQKKMLERNVDPKFTVDDARIKNGAAVWKILTTSEHALRCSGGPCPLQYGGDIVIRNQFPGEYMLHMLQPNVDPKFTVHDERIANKAAVWKILDVTMHRTGCVMYGARVLIENQYTDPKEMLVRNFDAPKFTVVGDGMENDMAVWKILDASKQRAGCVRIGDTVLIENQYSVQKAMLQRNVDPKFTIDKARIVNKAAVWKILPPSKHVALCSDCTKTGQSDCACGATDKAICDSSHGCVDYEASTGVCEASCTGNGDCNDPSKTKCDRNGLCKRDTCSNNCWQPPGANWYCHFCGRCCDSDAGLQSAQADSGSWYYWTCAQAANRGYCNHGTLNKRAMQTHCLVSCQKKRH